jgi:hypothetical protein
MVFNWFRGNKAASTAKPAHDEDVLPPQIRKPQHAYRDARMSIPIAEREFYETIQARKLSSLASSVLNGDKGKARSPLSGELPLPSRPIPHKAFALCAAVMADNWSCLKIHPSPGLRKTLRSRLRTPATAVAPTAPRPI